MGKAQKVKVRLLKDNYPSKVGDIVTTVDNEWLAEAIETGYMERVLEDKPKEEALPSKYTRYQCKNCEAISTVNLLTRPEKIQCCDNPEQVLLSSTDDTEMTFEECYNEILAILREFLDADEKMYKFVATWIIGTYFHSQFKTFPLLFFNAMRGSGKTRTLHLVNVLSNGGDGGVLNNVTESGVFRRPKHKITCFDEMERIGDKDKNTLRELFNAAYKQGMKVMRMKKVVKDHQEEYRPEYFEPFYPIAMANIWGFEEVLSDRAVTFVLEKSVHPMKTRLVENFEDDERILQIKRTLEKFSVVVSLVSPQKHLYREWNNFIKKTFSYSFPLSTATTLTTLYTPTTQTTQTTQQQEVELGDGCYELNELFEKINSANIVARNFELMFPIILTASKISKEITDDIIQICQELVDAKKQDESNESLDVALIEFISLRNNHPREFVYVSDLATKFKTYIGDLGVDSNWMNVNWMGRALKRLNLYTDKKRIASGRMVLLNTAKAAEKMKMFQRGEPDDSKI